MKTGLMNKNMKKEQIGIVVTEIIDAAVRVHRDFGPGFLVSVYHRCLVEELRSRGWNFTGEVYLPVSYRGNLLEKDLK